VATDTHGRNHPRPTTKSRSCVWLEVLAKARLIDIVSRGDGKNVLIAECKFWKGEEAFLIPLIDPA
jgi:hypothetical protein